MTRLIACAAVIALLTATGHGLAGDEVPFKGCGTATWVSTDYVNLTSLFSVAGKSTHTGILTGWSVVHYDPVTFRPTGADVTLVAANGDVVHLSTVSVYDPDTGTATATYSITGGTGRFEDATGSGDWYASGMGTVAISWDGDISY